MGQSFEIYESFYLISCVCKEKLMHEISLVRRNLRILIQKNHLLKLACNILYCESQTFAGD